MYGLKLFECFPKTITASPLSYATQNEANRINAQAVLGMNEIAQANLWQSYRDDAQFLIQTTECK